MCPTATLTWVSFQAMRSRIKLRPARLTAAWGRARPSIWHQVSARPHPIDDGHNSGMDFALLGRSDRMAMRGRSILKNSANLVVAQHSAIDQRQQ